MDVGGVKLKPSFYPMEEVGYTIFSRGLPPAIQTLISFLPHIKNKHLTVN